MTQLQWDDARVARWLGRLDALEAELQRVLDERSAPRAVAGGFMIDSAVRS